MGKGEDFWRERHRREEFLFFLIDFLFWVALYHERVASSPEACICHQDKLFSWQKLF